VTAHTPASILAAAGKASLHLGHRTATLAAQAYIDWGQVRKTTPVTPRLMEAGQSAE